MTLLALLVSTDDSVADVLGRVLPACGIAMERFSDLASAVSHLQQQKFDAGEAVLLTALLHRLLTRLEGRLGSGK